MFITYNLILNCFIKSHRVDSIVYVFPLWIVCTTLLSVDKVPELVAQVSHLAFLFLLGHSVVQLGYPWMLSVSALVFFTLADLSFADGAGALSFKPCLHTFLMEPV